MRRILDDVSWSVAHRTFFMREESPRKPPFVIVIAPALTSPAPSGIRERANHGETALGNADRSPEDESETLSSLDMIEVRGHAQETLRSGSMANNVDREEEPPSARRGDLAQLSAKDQAVGNSRLAALLDDLLSASVAPDLEP